MGSHDNLPVGALPLKNLLPLHESRFSPRYPVVGLGWAPLASLGIAERGKGSLSVCRWFLVPQNRAAVCLSSQFMYLYGYRSTHDVCRGLAGTGAWNSMYCHHACMMQGSRKSEPVTWVPGSSREGVNTEHTGRPGRGSVSQEGGTGPPPLVLLECWYAGGGQRTTCMVPIVVQTRILPLSSLRCCTKPQKHPACQVVSSKPQTTLLNKFQGSHTTVS